MTYFYCNIHYYNIHLYYIKSTLTLARFGRCVQTIKFSIKNVSNVLPINMISN
jgi:hypothetical protein